MLAGCAAAGLALAVRTGEVVGELRRDRHAAAAYELAVRLQLAGSYAEAADAYRAVLEISPNAIEAYGALAEVESRRGRPDEAIRVYRRLLAIYPYTYVGALHREVGLIELRAGLVPDARADLEQAVRLDPEDWLGHYFLGHTYKRLGDRASARRAWQQVVSLRPDYRPVHEQLRALDY